MSIKQTVVIGGKEYDAHTGLPVNPTAHIKQTSHAKRAVSSSSVHAAVQRSQTLKRAVVKKVIKPPVVASRVAVRRSADIFRVKNPVQKSPQILRFAAHPVAPSTPKSVSRDITAAKHPSLARAHKNQNIRQTPKLNQTIPSHALKQQLVSSALEATTTRQHTVPRLSLKQRFPRLFSVASASMASLILVGYIAYLNLPTISIHVAAAHAGINATYPDYRPDGYRLAGLISSSDGEVSMQFAANAGPQNFSIKESRSGWDSTAVLENYIKPKTAGEYVTYNENGLTIYTYGTNAAWVNGGILYTINGDAPLSNEQIRRIATSL